MSYRQGFCEKYNKLNESFDEECVFRVGISQGFFSEINNMIFAMLYCLDHKIKFVLYSDDANFSNNKGWEEFFLPFCDQVHESFHKKYNFKIRTEIPFKKNSIRMLYVIIYKWFHGIDFLTYDVFDSFFNTPYLKVNDFHIEPLEISGKASEASRNLVDMVWRFNPSTAQDIEKIIESLNLPSKYVAMHIRGGDKIIEKYMHGDLLDIDVYIKKIEKINKDVKNIFVFTDDYLNIEKLKIKRPQWNVFTLCEKDEHGYFNHEFNLLSWDKRKKQLLKLFANIEIIARSDIFFGTATANPYLFLALKMDSIKMCKVDCNKYWPF